MGLRIKLIAGIMLPLALMGALSTVVLRKVVLDSYQSLELDEGVRSVERLAQALQTEAYELKSIAHEWGDWSELYSYVETRDARFKQQYINLKTLTGANLSWIVLLDNKGRLIDQIRQTGAFAPSFDAWPSNDKARLALHRMAKRGSDAKLSNCDLVLQQGRLMLMCRKEITDSDTSTAARGVAILGREVDPSMLARMAGRTQLHFRLNIGAPPASSMAQLPLRQSALPFGRNSLSYLLEADNVALHWDLLDLAGQPSAQMVIEAPRLITARGHDLLHTVWFQLGMLLLLAVLAMLLTVDRLVVVRLAKLGAKLDGVRRSRDWTTRMPVSSNDEIGQVAQLSNGLLDVIATQIGELEQMAMLDSLTGLANRRAFDQCIDELVRQHGRNGQSLALVLIDVDYFKRYNDLYGHPMGDEALRRLGQVLRLAAHRSSDLAARVGGEEFALLLPCSDAAGAQTVAAQLLGEVVACAIAHDGSDYAVLTVSAGVALFASTDSAATLYRRADQALYKAKHGGRNRTVIASAV